MAKKDKKSKDSTPVPHPYGATRELVVMAKSEVGLRATAEGVASAFGADVSPLAEVLSAAGVTIRPLFGVSEERMSQKAEAMAAAVGESEETRDLPLYYQVDAPDEKLDDLAEQLQGMDAITAAYVKPPAEPAVFMIDEQPDAAEAPAVTPDFASRQAYLGPAPVGVDAHYAWTLAGGRGTGVKIIDCEWGWNFTHEDLVQNQMGVVVGTSSTNDNHGTAVLGEISGDRNSIGITGICPDATVGAASFVNKPSAQTIVEAADKLGAGDIILLEIHRRGPNGGGAGQQGYIAIEWWPDDYAAIVYAMNKGIIVVEAAGNGWEDLDDAAYDTPMAGFPATWKNPFNSANPNTGAIVVGAGNPPNPTHGRSVSPSPWNETYVDRARCGFSNWGSRVDTQGWGWEVTSTGYGNLQGGSDRNLWYTDTFSGTSSASPIIVGVLGCLQGILKAQGSPLLTPPRARNLLKSTGSPQQDATGRPISQRIGNRPNLRQLIPLASKTWHANKKVIRVYATSQSQNAWAYIQDVGWRKIKTGSPASVTAMFAAFCDALTSGKTVNVYADGSDIYRMYL
jgi:hypothetical protein